MSLDSHAHLFRPSPSGSARTLLLLHGTGDDERGFAQLAPLLDPAAAILSVRGNVKENGQNRFFRRRAEGVYDMEDLARRTAELIAFVAAALAHYRLEPEALAAVGYSNGANILASMLFQAPAGARTAVLLHPLIPFEPPAQPDLAHNRVLIGAGERDPICPPARTRALARYLEQQGAATRVVWHPGGHELRPEEIEAARAFLSEAGAVGR